MIQDSEIIEIIREMSNNRVGNLNGQTSINTLGFYEYESVQKLVEQLNEKLNIKLELLSMSSSETVDDIIKLVRREDLSKETISISFPEEKFRKEKNDLFKIIGGKGGEDIVQLQAKLEDGKKKLEQYAKEIKDSTAPIEKFRLSWDKLETILPPSRKDVSAVVTAVYCTLKDITENVLNGMDIQNRSLSSLSEIVRKIICLEADLYDLLYDSSIKKNEAILVLQSWCKDYDIREELFESLVTKADERVCKQRERLRLLKESIDEKIDTMSQSYKELESSFSADLSKYDDKLNQLAKDYGSIVLRCEEIVEKSSKELDNTVQNRLVSMNNKLDVLSKDVTDVKNKSFFDSISYKIIVGLSALSALVISVASLLK